MTNNEISAILVIVLIALALALMLLSWRRRVRRQSGLPALVSLPADLGERIGSFDGLYLATTPADDHLNRIAVRGLGFRERGSVDVYAAGIVVLGDKFIPAGDIARVSRASWTIDRGVEPNGLSVIAWRLGDSALDSYFRLSDPEGFDAATTTYQQKKTGQK